VLAAGAIVANGDPVPHRRSEAAFLSMPRRRGLRARFGLTIDACPEKRSWWSKTRKPLPRRFVRAAVGPALGPNRGREVGEALDVCPDKALSRHALCATAALRAPAGELSTVGSTPASATERTPGATGWAVAAGAVMTGRALNAGTAKPSSRTVGALRMETTFGTNADGTNVIGVTERARVA